MYNSPKGPILAAPSKAVGGIYLGGVFEPENDMRSSFCGGISFAGAFLNFTGQYCSWVPRKARVSRTFPKSHFCYSPRGSDEELTEDDQSMEDSPRFFFF